MNHNLSELCSNLGIGNFYNSVSGKIAYDLAATSQFVFEKIIWEILNPFLENEILDVVLVGGCALNVLFNQKLKVFLNKNQKDLFVPCHPNDCGLSFGMFAKEFPEVIEDFNVYSGLEILDLEKLDLYKKSYKNKKFDFNEIVNFLKEGKIIGVVQNNSEIGPRSLGNRSIICLPTFPNMKDIINSKVKFREWYRPFAPVCRDQDINKYFIDAYESPYMSYAPLVNNQYKKDLLSITHVDNTARLQTVNEKTHSFFNSILKELDKNNLVPVILNTSFNIKGFPILSRIEDAFHVLNNTELDVLIIEDTLFYKQ